MEDGAVFEMAPGAGTLPGPPAADQILRDILSELRDASASYDTYEIKTVRVLAQAPGLPANDEYGWQEDECLTRHYALGWRLASEWLYQACNPNEHYPIGYFHVFKFHRKVSSLRDEAQWMGVDSTALYLRKTVTSVNKLRRRDDDIRLPFQDREDPETGDQTPYIRLEDLVTWIRDHRDRFDAKGVLKVGS
jgi:hypothetical protein